MEYTATKFKGHCILLQNFIKIVYIYIYICSHTSSIPRLFKMTDINNEWITEHSTVFQSMLGKDILPDITDIKYYHLNLFVSAKSSRASASRPNVPALPMWSSSCTFSSMLRAKSLLNVWLKYKNYNKVVYNHVTSLIFKGESKNKPETCSTFTKSYVHTAHCMGNWNEMTDTGENTVITQNKMSVVMDKPITSNGKPGLETCLRTAVWKSNRFTLKIFIFSGYNITTGWLVPDISRQRNVTHFQGTKCPCSFLGISTPEDENTTSKNAMVK